MKIQRILCKRCGGSDVIHYPKPSDSRSLPSPNGEDGKPVITPCEGFEKMEDEEVPDDQGRTA